MRGTDRQIPLRAQGPGHEAAELGTKRAAVLPSRLSELEEGFMSKRRNWSAIIDRLNTSPQAQVRVKMGSPGSAQVTRCRLLAEWNNLAVTTVGSTLFLRLK